MANVYFEACPKGRPEPSPIEDYVVEDHADSVLKTFKTQHEAIEWARKQGHHPLVAREQTDFDAAKVRDQEMDELARER